MQPIDYSAAVAERIELPGLSEKGIAMEVLRLDKIHPAISGNKVFKLRLYLEEAVATGKQKIGTYGGAWSNHIVATAAACKLESLACTGFIRGEEPEQWSSTLRHAKELGMELVFMSREAYRLHKRDQSTTDDQMYMIPEGGFGIKGVLGASDILKLSDDQQYTHICCAAGTGTMAAGLSLNLMEKESLVVVSVLKNNLQLQNDIRSLNGGNARQPDILHDYHFGGYAKYDPTLIRFMNTWYSQTGVPSDFVYTGKLFYAVNDLLLQHYFPAGSRILLIHSGGLQGNDSLGKGTLIF